MATGRRTRKPVVDVHVEDLGTILLLRGQSRRGQAWLRRHVAGGQATVKAERRMGLEIVDGLYQAGLTFVNAARPGTVYGQARG